MRWLIVEDSLENRKGHWFEYLSGFQEELPGLGDEVILAISRRAEPFLMNGLAVHAILPESVFNKMSDGASILRRYIRIPLHAWTTFWAVRRAMKSLPEPELIFVPTVTIHHLLGWFWLIKSILGGRSAKVLLFFPGLPIRQCAARAMLDGSPTSKLMYLLLRRLAGEIGEGRVILGVETQPMKAAAEHVFDVPFTYFPHPVTLKSEEAENRKQKSDSLTFACYGPARHEKGSDVLALAIEQFLHKHPQTNIKFAIQWLENFSLSDGSTFSLPAALKDCPQVEIISRYFRDGEYEQRLSSTRVLMLPYRESYTLRVSRVVIEAMVNGIPVIVTRGTTLAEQAEKFGALITCDDGNVESLVKAIEEMEHNFQALKSRAEQQREKARQHFSVRQFREIVLSA